MKIKMSLKKLLFGLLEPLSPYFMRKFLERRLDKLRKNGGIGDYNVKVKRKRKGQYKINMELDLSGRQMRGNINKLVSKVIRAKGGDSID